MPQPIRTAGSRSTARLRRPAVEPTPSTNGGRTERLDRMERTASAVHTERRVAHGAARITGTPLTDGVAFASGALVVDGVRLTGLSLHAGSPSTGRASLLLEAARRLGGSGALEKLTQSARKALADDLMTLLRVRHRGRAGLVQTRNHAACFALLEELARSMRGPSEKSTVHRIAEALQEAARAESHAPLELFMRDRLDGKRADEPVFLPAPPFPDRRSISFRPDARAVPDAISLQAHTRAVTRLDALFASWAGPFGNAAARALAGNLKADGFFVAREGEPAVRLQKRGDTLEVALDQRFSRADPDVIAMLVAFEGTRALLGRTHPDASEHQVRMIALGMTARCVHDHVEHGDVADLLLDRFALVHRFPPSLSFAAVDKAMRAEDSAHTSPRMIAALERAMEFTFLEVNPRRTSTKFRRYIGKAMDLLMRSSSPVGRRTYEAIATGKVTVDDLSDLNAADYARLRRDFAKDGVHVHERREGVIDGRSMRAITTSIAGYMWDERIYVAAGMDPTDVARALVHEVNHVLNESEEHYRSAKPTLIEEYRAFYAESLFVGENMTPAKCKALKERVIRDYNLEGVTPDDVPDVPPGII